MTNNTLDNPSPADDAGDAADARIDAMARTAGSQLRRPAPERGFAQVKRARRTQQVTRAALGGTIALAVVAMGAFAVNRRTNDIAPAADVTISSTEPQASAPPNPPPTTAVWPTIPTTAAALPPTTAEVTEPGPTAPAATDAGGVVATDDPSVVYVSTQEDLAEQTLIDPVTGETIRTEPRDGAQADAIRSAGVDLEPPSNSVGGVTYDFTEAGYQEYGGEPIGDPDRCLQTPLTVTSPAGSALPARALQFKISPSRQYVVTASTTCPEAGGAGTNLENRTTLPFETTIQVFDAAHPELPGRPLATQPPSNNVFNVTFSRNGRFAAMLTYVGSGYRYFIYDLETGSSLDIAPDCTHSGDRPQVAYDVHAPWVGQSSIAFGAQCPDGPKVAIADLATGKIVEIPIPFTPVPDANPVVYVEVDQQHYSTADTAWFTACGYLQSQCWVGNSQGQLIELPNTTVASFLPLSEYIYGD